ncbi:MAG: cation:proton antiporter [Pseudomonadota bacterium]
MDYEWVALGLSEVTWIALAFVLGLLARTVGLPPLVGFLVAGFLLNAQGVTDTGLLQKLADLGITLLLFTVGLKLNLGTLARPQVWAVAGIHMGVVIALFTPLLFMLTATGLSLFVELNLQEILLVAFALSFSSTVFVVKILEERGDISSLHGRIAIGILLMQDVAAVIFLVFASGKVPTLWSLAVIGLLIAARPLLHQMLQRVGHGELLVLCGFMLALGGAELFEAAGLKGDLGALFVGILIASHAKAEEMAKTMLSFKDLFLLAFFLSIGLAGQPTADIVGIALLLTPLVLLKSALFYWLLTRFNLRARTSLLASVNLTNYSEFGLIVAAVGVTNGWLSTDWLMVIAIALAFSFVLAAAASKASHWLYSRYHGAWLRLQRKTLIPDDQLFDLDGATIAIIGMGGVGMGAYETMRTQHGDTVVGVDIDPVTTRRHQEVNRHVICGDPSDADFWDRVQASHTLELVMLALPKLDLTVAVLNRLRETGFQGHIAATARFPDELETLNNEGAVTVFNIYTEAGAGYAGHVAKEFLPND